MRELEEKIGARGARAVVVGTGAPGFIAPFREATDFRGEIWTDPSRSVFEAAGFKRSAARTLLHPGAALAGIRALTGGFRQGSTQGDPWQLGGVLVVRPPGELAWSHESRFAGDHPDAEALLAALVSP
ncbi:AhpC/TSA family protein [bacterium]|nr:AhpC/TSA family protein [bacterium]